MNGPQFRDLRLARGWSQARMAVHLGVSTRQVANIERERSGISGPLYRLLVLTFGRDALPYSGGTDDVDP